MNKEQLAYQAGRLGKSVYVDPLLLLSTLYAGAVSFKSFSLARENPNSDNIADGVVYIGDLDGNLESLFYINGTALQTL